MVRRETMLEKCREDDRVFELSVLAGSVLDFEVLDASNFDCTDTKSSALKAYE